jgi:ribonuclease HI
MAFYAVARGRLTGIFLSWAECNSQIKGFSGALYKKFDTRIEAEDFIAGPKPQAPTEAAPKPLTKAVDNVDYYVYTDGSCSNNGKPNAQAGIGIYFDADDSRNVSRRVLGKQSNNTAELTAIIETYPLIADDLKQGRKVAIMSDSVYAIRCATTYGTKCAKEAWASDIPNKDLVQKIYNLYNAVPNVKFIHIAAHTGKTDIHSIGNDGADRLANEAIGLTQCPYNKVYLNVPFAKKDEAKALGARWDPQKKKWYIFDNMIHAPILLSQYT